MIVLFFTGGGGPTGVDADAVVALSGVTGASAGTFTPPVYDADGVVALSGVAAAAAATFDPPVFDADGAVDLSGVAGVAAATFVAPVFDADGVVALSGISGAAVAAFTAPVFDASAAVDLSGVTAAAAGTFTPPVFDADGVVALSGITGVAAANYAGSISLGLVAVDLSGVTAAAAATFDPPIFDGDAALDLSGVEVAAAGTFDPPVFDADGAVDLSGVTAAAAAIYAAEIFAASAAGSISGASGSAAAAFGVQVAGSADVSIGSVVAAAAASASAPGVNFANVVAPSVSGSAGASYAVRYVPWTACAWSSGVANKDVAGVAPEYRSGRAEKPYIPDGGCSPDIVHLTVTANITTGGTLVTATATASGPPVGVTAALTTGSVIATSIATFDSGDVAAAAPIVVKPVRCAGGFTFSIWTSIADSVAVAIPPAAASAAASYSPTFRVTAAAGLARSTAAATATFASGTRTASAGVSLTRVRGQGGVVTTRPTFTASAGSTLSRIVGAATGISNTASFVASVSVTTGSLITTGEYGVDWTSTGDAVVTDDIGSTLTYGTDAMSLATFFAGGFGASTVVEVGAVVATAIASTVAPGNAATLSRVFNPITFAAVGTNTLAAAGGSVLHTFGPATAAATAQFTKPVFNVLQAPVIIRHIRTNSIVTFQPSGPGGQTPLAQPSWLEWPEDYPYPKIGIAYDAVTYQTILQETNMLIASDSTQLAQHLNTARANSAIDGIYLDPAGNTFQMPVNAFNGINRPLNRPFVFKTLPGSVIQGRVNKIDEQKVVNGLAIIDIEHQSTCQLIGGGDGLLIERCEGGFSVEGTRAKVAPGDPVFGNLSDVVNPFYNVIWRLNVIKDRFNPNGNLAQGAFCFGVDGLLVEGNIFEHNGWDPALTRAAGRYYGGGSTQNHNLYLTRPNFNCHIRYNITSRPSSHGFHTKSGAFTRRNMFVKCPIGTQIGWGADVMYAWFQVSGNTNFDLVRNTHTIDNLFLGSDETNTFTGDATYPSENYRRGIGFWVTCVDGHISQGNYLIDNGTSASNDQVYRIDTAFPVRIDISGAKVKNWPGPIVNLGNGAYPTPTVTQSGTPNSWNTTVSPAAQSLSDAIQQDTYLDTLKFSRVRYGVDINQLKSDMDFIRAGFA